MISLVLFTLGLLACAFGASIETVSANGLTFQAVNVTTAQSDARFNYRALTATTISVATVFASLEVDAQISDTGASGSLDAIVGCAFASPSTTVILNPIGNPGAWMIYFGADAGFDISDISLDMDVSASGGLVGKVFTKVEEISPSGNFISTYTFRQRAWTRGPLKTAPNFPDLKYVTYTSRANNFDVDLTFAVSAVLGRLNVGDATITPRNLESFVEIRNFPYANPENHLRLTFFIGHVSKSSSKIFKGTNTVIVGKGKEQIYFKLSDEAVVDGEVVPVTVEGLEASDILPSELGNTILTTYLEAVAGVIPEIRLVKVDFPAGATVISYDPAIGFGAPNAAGLLLPSIAKLLIPLCVLFFFF